MNQAKAILLSIGEHQVKPVTWEILARVITDLSVQVYLEENKYRKPKKKTK